MLKLKGWVLTILAIATVATATPDEFNLGYTLGQQAYIYGLPLSIMEYTYEVQTSTVPVNKFNYYRSFATPEDTVVVAPNFDTLYAIAWLDLSKGPVMLHLPEELYSNVNNVAHRFWVVALYDPYTNNFMNLGSVAQTEPGDYAIVWRNHRSAAFPKHWKFVECEYKRVWIIQRIYAINDNAADIQFVNTLQDLITLTPLSHYFFGNRENENSPSTVSSTPTIPTGMAFYDQLCDLLLQFPPPSADYSFLSTLIQIGIVPGLKPSKNFFLSADTVDGMVAAVSNGTQTVLNELVKMYKTDFAIHNGYLVADGGVYGTNYTLRAVLAQVGLGALTPNQAVYPLALYDRVGKPLLGFQKYKITIVQGGLPPVNGFWSVTMYTNKGFLVPNAIHRYCINDRSTLYHNPDGSVDIYIQPTPPTDPNQAQNWLPTPPGGAFQVIWRLYALEPSAIPGILSGQGWQAPPIMPVA